MAKFAVCMKNNPTDEENKTKNSLKSWNFYFLNSSNLLLHQRPAEDEGPDLWWWACVCSTVTFPTLEMRNPSMYSRIFLGYESAAGASTFCRSVMAFSLKSTLSLNENFPGGRILPLEVRRQVNDEDGRMGPEQRVAESAHPTGERESGGGGLSWLPPDLPRLETGAQTAWNKEATLQPNTAALFIITHTWSHTSQGGGALHLVVAPLFFFFFFALPCCNQVFEFQKHTTKIGDRRGQPLPERIWGQRGTKKKVECYSTETKHPTDLPQTARLALCLQPPAKTLTSNYLL